MLEHRGMVQVEGVTYRVRSVSDRYEVVRLLDDQRVGAFGLEPRLRLLEQAIATELLLNVAREAMRRCIACRDRRRA